MVENEEITGTMRAEGENDPVSEFIGKTFKIDAHAYYIIHSFYCKQHFLFFSSLQGALCCSLIIQEINLIIKQFILLLIQHPLTDFLS